jgi:hypothetical protein
MVSDYKSYFVLKIYHHALNIKNKVNIPPYSVRGLTKVATHHQMNRSSVLKSAGYFGLDVGSFRWHQILGRNKEQLWESHRIVVLGPVT